MSDMKDKYIEDLMKRRSEKRNTGIFWFIAGVLIALALTSLDAQAQIDLRPLSEQLKDPRLKAEQRSSTADFYDRIERERVERRERYNEQAPTIIREIGNGVTLINKGHRQEICRSLGEVTICE